MLHPNTVTISHLTAWIVLLSVTWHVHQLVLKVGNETWACVARLGQQGTQRLGTTFFFFQFPLCFLAWASACHFIQCWWFLMMESDSIPIPQLPDSYCAKADRKTRGLEQLFSCAIALGQQVVFVCVCCWACSNLWRRCWMPAGFLGCMFVGEILESEDWSGLVPASGISTGFVLCCFSWRYVREMMRL